MSKEFTRIIENLDLDGRLPDFDYAKNEMLSLDDLNDDGKMLMEFDLVTIFKRKGRKNSIDLRLNSVNQSPDSEIHDVIVVEVPEKKLDSVKTIGELKPGDKIIKMNDECISSIDQALKILNDDGIQRIDLLIMRSNKVICSKIKCLKYSKSKSSRVYQPGQNHDRHHLSNAMIYTTEEKLAQMVHLQQSIMEGHLRSNRNKLIKERNVSSEITPKENSEQVQACETNEKWVIKKRSDGTRYITKKIIRNPSEIKEKQFQNPPEPQEKDLKPVVDNGMTQVVVPKSSLMIGQTGKRNKNEKNLKELRARFLESKKKQNLFSVTTV